MALRTGVEISLEVKAAANEDGSRDIVVRLLVVLCLASGILAAQTVAPPYWGTVFVDPNILTASDPTTFQGVADAGRENRTMWDRRAGDWIRVRAYLFNARFDDGLTMEIQVNPELGSAEAALAVAEEYGESIGRIPTSLRTGVQSVWIHRGLGSFGGGNNNILIHRDTAEEHERGGYLEEVLMHEGVHSSLDPVHLRAPGWQVAQDADGGFISEYARDYPDREDLAETFVPYFALRYREGRIPHATWDTIMSAIPNRIAYLDSLELDMHPHGVRHVPMMTSSGIVRIINRSEDSGTVTVHAVDSSGQRFGPATVRLDASTVIQLKAGELGVGASAGPWRLELSTTLRIQASSYARNSDGTLAGLHHVAEAETAVASRYRVPFFLPADDARQEGLLRLINLSAESAAIIVSGMDDTGTPSSGEVSLTVEGEGTRVLTAGELEQGGTSLTGSLGNGTGQWRLVVNADRRIQVMSLARSRTSGALTNLSR